MAGEIALVIDLTIGAIMTNLTAYLPGDTLTLTLADSAFIPAHDEVPLILDVEPLTTTVLEASACDHVSTVCPACIESWSFDWEIVRA